MITVINWSLWIVWLTWITGLITFLWLATWIWDTHEEESVTISSHSHKVEDQWETCQVCDLQVFFNYSTLLCNTTKPPSSHLQTPPCNPSDLISGHGKRWGRLRCRDLYKNVITPTISGTIKGSGCWVVIYSRNASPVILPIKGAIWPIILYIDRSVLLPQFMRIKS